MILWLPFWARAPLHLLFWGDWPEAGVGSGTLVQYGPGLLSGHEKQRLLLWSVFTYPHLEVLPAMFVCPTYLTQHRWQRSGVGWGLGLNTMWLRMFPVWTEAMKSFQEKIWSGTYPKAASFRVPLSQPSAPNPKAELIQRKRPGSPPAGEPAQRGAGQGDSGGM